MKLFQNIPEVGKQALSFIAGFISCAITYLIATSIVESQNLQITFDFSIRSKETAIVEKTVVPVQNPMYVNPQQLDGSLLPPPPPTY